MNVETGHSKSPAAVGPLPGLTIAGLMTCTVDSAVDAVYWIDRDARFIYANESASLMLGYTREQLLGMTVPDIDPTIRAEEWHDRWDASREQGSSIFESTHRGAGGETIPVEITSRHLEYEGVEYICAFARDIRKRKEVEAALRESEERFRILVEQAADALFVHDFEGRIEDVNARASAGLGYERDELIGMHVSAIETNFVEARVKAFWDELEPGRPVTIEGRHRRRDGSTFPVEVRIGVVESGGERRILALARDITQRKRAEAERIQLAEQLRHGQKMEAIGELAGGVAHDFNNVLTAILGYASLLELQSESPEDVVQAAGVIVQAAERAQHLTGQLLGFARKGKNQNIGVNMHERVEEACQLLARTVEKTIRIRQSLEAKVPWILGDPDQIQQVLVNLAVNARDAMQGEGELTIATEDVTISHHHSPAIGQLETGRYVRLTVSDTGPGIPNEIRERIFEPFFTTKERGKGTGMGLAMVYGIIKNHGGAIEVRSSAEGTEFEILLPCHDRPAPRKAKLATPAAPSGAGHVLLVDDEEIVRSVASAMLRSLGYSVETAVDGRDAIAVFERSPEPFDLAIIDMMMPNLNGRDCFHALRAIDPELRAILSTGYAQGGGIQDIFEEGMAGFVAKPYRIHQLAEAVARVMAPDSTPTQTAD